jgi:hypothetical protein
MESNDMGVYVDRLRDWGWHLGPSCHLIADTQKELHAFAARLGLRRTWFQGSRSDPHYDLVASKRALAVRLGAIELEDRAFVDLLRRLRKKETT